MIKENVLIVGTVSNVSNVLVKDFERVFKSLSRFNSVSTYLVESDSTDKTNKVLSELKGKYSNFKYAELGTLRNTIPDRIERIRFCRNVYVKFIRDNMGEKNWEYIIVVDLDGMNSKLTKVAVDTCFEDSANWDACFANQKYGYYDLYALRHPEWMPNNCFDDLAKEKAKIPLKYFGSNNLFLKIIALYIFDRARKVTIYDKMKILEVNSEWIKVQSAFGGFGIYKSKLLIECNYDRVSDSQFLASEHVDINTKLISKGYSLFINPNLVNSNWNTYNVNRFFFIRQFRNFLRKNPNFRKLVKRFFGGGGGI